MRRVVVTGLGMVTPLGCGVEPTWSRLLEGKSGANRIEGFKIDASAQRALKPSLHDVPSFVRASAPSWREDQRRWGQTRRKSGAERKGAAPEA